MEAPIFQVIEARMEALVSQVIGGSNHHEA